jgi:FMN phosphatase YigB (HAD superfamily)
MHGSSSSRALTSVYVQQVQLALRLHRPALVSVDVFDTLLLSRVHSAVTRRLECEYLARLLPASAGVSLQALLEQRQTFDQQRTATSYSGKGEPGLDDWARLLQSRFPNLAAFPVHEWARQSWQQTVLGTHVPNHALWNALSDNRVRTGCTLCVTSDTMADTSLLQDTLERYSMVPDVVIASSSHGASKASGKLFSAVRAIRGNETTPILHIGDDFRADVWQAGSAGMRPLWLPRHAPMQRRVERALSHSPLHHVRQLLSAAPADVQTVESFAATVLCPLLVLLHAAVMQHVRTSQADCTVFLARDAWLMFQCASALEDVAPLGVPTHYLRASRRIVTAAHPVDLLSNADGVAGRKGKETVGRLLAPFSLPTALRDQLLATAGVELNTPLNEKVRALLVNAVREHADAWEAERARQRDLLGRWVKQELGDVQRPLFVDSGWVGTSQDSMTAACPNWVHSSGVYLGLSHPHPTTLPVSRWGLLRDDSGTTRHGRAVDRLASTLRIWEVVLREPAASVVGLREDSDGRLGAVLAETTDDDAAERALATRMTGSVTAALQQQKARWRAIIALAQSLSLDDLRTLAREVTHSFVYRPGSQLASDLLAVGYDEAAGHRRSLAQLAQDPRDVWWPGVLASRLAGRSSG